MTKERISKIAEWMQPTFGFSAGLMIAANIGTFWVIVAIWLFLTKDVALIIFATLNKHKGLFVSGILSAMLNIFGIIRWTFY